jgi:membrane protein required for colicin V production
MTWFDYAVLAAVGISMLLGLFRGLVRELMALAGWVAAFVLATLFADKVSTLIPSGWVPQTLGKAGSHVAAFVGILIVVWVAAAVLGWLLARLVHAAGLGWPDRVLGAVFGVARGLLVVLVAVMLAGLTTLPRQPAWRDAVLSGPLETAVIAARPLLPVALAQRVKYR